jgi:hypothetical protein
MASKERDYTETNTPAKKGMDESMKKVFLGYIDTITDKLVHGWVCNCEDFNETLWVEVYADNVKIGRAHANIYRNDLKDNGIGNGNYSFNYELPSDVAGKNICVKVSSYNFELPKSKGLLDTEFLATLTLDDLVTPLNKFPRNSHILAHIIYHYMPNGCPSVQYFCEPTIQEDESVDINFCGRLITAFRASTSKFSSETANSGMWKLIGELFHGPLYNILEEGNPLSLAKCLCNAYRDELCHGFAHIVTPDMQNPKSGIGTRMVDNLMSLGEALGVIQYENPEQGRYGINVYENIDDVVLKIEKKVGVPIGKPKVFGLHGIKNGDKVIDVRASSHLWSSWRMREIVGLNKNICEIGGGFGGCCYYSHLMGAKSYTIIDLPLINVVSAYFLMKCFGEEAVQLFGEENCGQPIKIMPSSYFMSENNNFDICFNQDSFPELPIATVLEYMERISEVTRSYFYHINQEGCAITHEKLAQLNIHQIMADMSSYKLLYRYPNWIRKGYVEELYSIVNPLHLD